MNDQLRLPMKRSFSFDLRSNAKYEAAKTALKDIGSQCSYTHEDLLGLAESVWLFAQNSGLRPGDTVLSLLPNNLGQIIYFIGLTSGGFSFAPLSSDSSLYDVERAIDALAPRLVLVPAFLSPKIVAQIEKQGATVHIVDSVNPQMTSTDKAGASLPRGDSDKAFLFIRSSGTTGEQKFIAHKVDRLWSAACHFVAFHEHLGPKDRFLNIFPLDTMAGLFNMCLIPLAAKGSIYFDSDFNRRMSSARIWHNVRLYDISVLWVIPSLLQAMLGDDASPMHSFAHGAAKRLSCIFVGMSSVHGQIKAQFMSTFNVPVLENYAMTETTFVSSETVAEVNASRSELNSSGHILPWVSVGVQQVSQELLEGLGSTLVSPLPSNDLSLSELVVRSPYMSAGFVRDAGKIEELSLSPVGYFTTGDLAAIDAEGRLQVQGRIREVIKSAGELVNLCAVEATIESHPGVDRVAAVGVQHDTLGESYILFVVLSGGVNAAALSELEAWLHDLLPRRMWPNRVIAVEEMPLTASGKIKKHMICQQYQASESLDRDTFAKRPN